MKESRQKTEREGEREREEGERERERGVWGGEGIGGNFKKKTAS